MSTDVLAPPSEPAPPAPRTRHGPAALIAGAALSAAAAAVHVAVVPEHLDEYVPFGLFFVAVAAAQLVGAVLVLAGRGLRTVAASGVGLVALWLVSRTVGLPLGPDGPWVPEDVGVPDVVCAAVEVFAALVLLATALRGPRPRRRRPVRTPLAVAPVVLVAALAATVGVGTASTGMGEGGMPGGPTGGVPVTALRAAPGPEPVRAFTLTAQTAVIDGRVRETLDGTVPGPELRVTQGDRVRVTLVDHLPVATTLHWHGVRVPGAEDGVAGMTQDAVAPGGSYTYEFVATDVGTYWYHSHQDTGHQIADGLFGALVVEPPGGRVPESVDQTVIWHDGHDGLPVAADGAGGTLHLDAAPGQTVRLRVVDAVAPDMDGTSQAPVLVGAPYRVAALDGHDLTGGTELGPQRLALGMGQRVDLVFTMPPTGEVRLVGGAIAGTPSPLQGFFASPPTRSATVVVGAGPSPAVPDAATLPVFDPLRYGSGPPVPADVSSDVFSDVVLGETPGFHDGAVALVHTINGAASPDVPPIVVRPGQRVRLHLVNTTGEFHPMHIHGHVFTVLDVDGRPATGSPVHLDTVLMWPHGSADVTFVADNPGLWMFHCHVPVHAEMGMSMNVVYAGVGTPFMMGGRSGNVPE